MPQGGHPRDKNAPAIGEGPHHLGYPRVERAVNGQGRLVVNVAGQGFGHRAGVFAIGHKDDAAVFLARQHVDKAQVPGLQVHVAQGVFERLVCGGGTVLWRQRQGVPQVRNQRAGRFTGLLQQGLAQGALAVAVNHKEHQRDTQQQQQLHQGAAGKTRHAIVEVLFAVRLCGHFAYRSCHLEMIVRPIGSSLTFFAPRVDEIENARCSCTGVCNVPNGNKYRPPQQRKRRSQGEDRQHLE